MLKGQIPPSLVEIAWALKYANTRFADSKDYIDRVAQQHGIEIGGPSPLFRYVLPLYKSAASIDGVNFSNRTIWEGELRHSCEYKYYKGKVGTHFILDATHLSLIGDNTYDFLISSNCLEHIANPLKALDEWRRVVKHNPIYGCTGS
jgi:SAM-dependent methyltransferase